MRNISLFTNFIANRTILGKICGIFTIAWFIYNLFQLFSPPFSGRPDYFFVISSFLGFIFFKIED